MTRKRGLKEEDKNMSKIILDDRKAKLKGEVF